MTILFLLELLLNGAVKVYYAINEKKSYLSNMFNYVSNDNSEFYTIHVNELNSVCVKLIN